MTISFLSIKKRPVPHPEHGGDEKKLKTQPSTEKLCEYIKKEIFFNKENRFPGSDPRSPVAPPKAGSLAPGG
jgi:hypothetical protein